MRYRPEIDGLRAIAVIPVILFHAGFSRFSGGFVGVDVFFVISGYLITTIILDELEQGKFSIINFYERRARRILPALFFVMFVCLPFAWFWLLPQDMKGFSKSLVAVSLFASNVLFWRESGYFDSAAELKPLLHTWSLAVEEQYYVLFPLFLMLAWRFGKHWIVAALSIIFLLSLGLAQLGSVVKPAATFFLLPTRGWELLIGAFVAFYFSSGNQWQPSRAVREMGGVLGLFLLFTAIFKFDKQTPFPSFWTLLPTIGTALIIFCSTQQTAVGKLLGNKLFVGIGLISYSAYLWHQPLFAFARHRSWEEPSNLLMIGLAITSVLLAYLSWKYIEKPFRARKVIKRKIVFAFSIIGSIFFICIGVVGYMNSGFPKRSGFEKFSVIQYETNKLGYVKCEDSLVKEGSELNYCHRTNRRAVTAALIGDSHADDKFYGIEKNDLNRGWMFIGNSSCPPVLGISVEGDQKGCKEKFEKIIKFVSENKDINTVVLSFYGHYSLTTSYAADHIAKKVGPDTVKISSETMLGASRGDVFYFGLSQTVKKLLNADKKVVVLVDIPELPYFPNDCLKGRPNCQLVLGEVLERQSEHRNLLERLKSEFPSINIFDPIDIFCQNNHCGYKINEIILYRDSHHLTLGGSDYYGGAFVDWLDKTIR